jgi:hypothetical protein
LLGVREKSIVVHFNPEGLVTRLEADTNAPSPLVTKAESARSLTGMLLGIRQSEPQAILSAAPEPPAILELVETPGTSGTPDLTDCAMPDPLIQGLVDRLPKADSVWSIDDRGKWLRAAAVIFNLVYKVDEGDRDRHSSEPKALP